MLPEVSPASQRDSTRVVATLARAFEQDPVLDWVVRFRAQAFRRFFAANFIHHKSPRPESSAKCAVSSENRTGA